MRRLTASLYRYETWLVAGLLATGIGALIFDLVPPAITCVAGDMRARYDARVPPALAQVYFDAERMRVGVGTAAIGGWQGLGDALVVGGRAFVRHTNRLSPRYYDLGVNRYFQSNAFVYVPEERAPSATYLVPVNTRMDQLLEQLVREYPQGVIAAGAMRFATLRMIAMSVPAIGGKPVTQFAVRYYTRPMESSNDSWAYVVLIAARDDRERLGAVLPPAAIRTVAAGHALALRLREAPAPKNSAPTVENAMAVGQLLKDAVATEGRLELYPVAHVFECAAARADATTATAKSRHR